MSTVLKNPYEKKINNAIVDQRIGLMISAPKIQIKFKSSSSIEFPDTVGSENIPSNSTYLEDLRKNDTRNVLELKSSIDYQIDEDPMKKLSGEDANNMLKLLTTKGKKNSRVILKDSKFKENSVSFKLKIKYKDD